MLKTNPQIGQMVLVGMVTFLVGYLIASSWNAKAVYTAAPTAYNNDAKVLCPKCEACEHCEDCETCEPCPEETERQAETETESHLVSAYLLQYPQLKVGLDGMFELPGHITEVRIDVGASIKSELVEVAKKNPSIFCIAFEPTPRVFKKHQIDFPPTSNFVLINAAASPDIGIIPFYDGPGTHCNSILKRNPDLDVKDVHECQKVGAPVPVVAMPLKYILSRIPEDLPVKLKIDAQGYDLEVAKSTVPYLHRIKSVKLECQEVEGRKEILLYPEARECHQSHSWFESQGWTKTSCKLVRDSIKEYDCFYIPA